MLLAPTTVQVLSAVVQCNVTLIEGLLLLWKAFNKAQQQQPPLEVLAIPLLVLVQAGLPEEELARLVVAGVIAWRDGQVPRLGGRRGRRQTAAGYVLTSGGATAVIIALRTNRTAADLAESGFGELQVLVVPTERPVWDGAMRQLWWRSRLVKQFRHDASNQRLIFMAFEEQGWPARIDDPLPHIARLNRKDRLREAVKSLNRGQKPLVLRFHTDGASEGIRWEAVL
jgi:hypothetical protein